ncbi:23S rRNA (cytosine1962-C5)-methyltransferase [Ardenticatena maritima]|uniref:23S rRNA (Cytosine1962-C5)-methyltransferase n=1 Tax=Ardenticatena maritima TaxID=872965 RepID=A0A0M8KB16_9CHLR|nr:class I SAM-dependent methyltransferase [Ardenticatena maritima]KPL90231.1 23S rRNA methyltransferase [Ardenticatena maritima]GAP64571.1 23S rRNA (cytosine1962-C5)-methyltransferase [Ardenticatena maritima]
MNRTITLKPKREKSVAQRHPWLFSGAIAHADAEAGDIVDVLDHRGQWLARGYYNPASQIAVRLLTFDPAERVDADFWRRRLERAIARRRAPIIPDETNAYRLVNAESDGLPGLIVDRYADFLVLQSLTLGIERHKATIVEALADLLAPRGIYERSDEEVRRLEGLEPTAGLVWGEAPPALVRISEHGLSFWVDVVHGHKTGFYLDQRENRALIRRFAAGRRVLNCFAYTGGFTVAALAGGATATISVESSADALALARENIALNGFADADNTFIEGNVFEVLRTFRDRGEQFDLIVLDPPKFAYTRRQIESAARGYKDINRLALLLLAPGGILMTFSCSGLVSADLFQQILFSAALDAGRDAHIIARMTQGPDHPVALTFPESAYLKGLVCLAS